MIGVFKQNNQGNALLLLFYALILKFPLFIEAKKPVTLEGDNYIYHLVIKVLQPFTDKAPVVFPLLAFLLFFTQATLLNRITNSLKLFPKPNYLVGMSFLLATSLMKDWTAFSAPLVINSLMIWTWYRMISLYNNNNPKTSIYNVAVLIGLLPLIYSPAVTFTLLLIMALLITRPLRITEWMVALFGILTPYYFVFVVLFLTDQWQQKSIIPFVTFRLPGLPASLWISVGILLLIVPFLAGGYYVQKNLNKMLIHTRKAWSLMLSFVLVSLLILLLNPGSSYIHWMLIVVPIAAFHGATYYYLTFRSAAVILQWITFVFCILLNYQLVRF